jgi:hypothetical protein
MIRTARRDAADNCINISMDKRGKHVPSNKLNAELITSHIRSYNPNVSHYRREHAPNRLYLPDSLTIREMHNNFKEKYPSSLCSYTTYRNVVNENNISFTKLGEEQCETCMLHQLHPKHTNEEQLCEHCLNWEQHIKSATEARHAYKDDGEKLHDPNHRIVSVDMQKVIMLPELRGVKTAIFTRRIIAFNETFAVVGKATEKTKNKCVLWHEGDAGRSAQEVADAFVKYLASEPLLQHVTLWLDNCSAQNKNWTLFSTLTTMVNLPINKVQLIILKYFVKGHTFMSADSVHHRIEQAIRKKGSINDFNDFVKITEGSSPTIEVLQLSVNDLHCWKPQTSAAKLKQDNRPKLCEMAKVMFKRGSNNIFYKKSHTDVTYIEFDVMKQNASFAAMPQKNNIARGVPSTKKQDIITKLCPLLPKESHQFWHDLKVNDGSPDLIDNY